MKIFLEAVDFSVADVCTVQERNEVQQCEPGNQFEVEFPEELAVLGMSVLMKSEARGGSIQQTIAFLSSSDNPSSGSRMSRITTGASSTCFSAFTGECASSEEERLAASAFSMTLEWKENVPKNSDLVEKA